MIRRPPRSTLDRSSAASDVYKRQNPGSFLNWANNIGVNTVYWVKKELKSVKHPPNVYNKLNAVLSMSKIYGKKELDLALQYLSLIHISEPTRPY